MQVFRSVKKTRLPLSTFENINYQDNKLIFDVYENISENNEISYLHFRPNTLNPYIESIAYNTDIIESFDGTEQRIPLLIQPRNKLTYFYTLFEKNLRDFNSFIFKNQSKVFKIPVWSEMTTLKYDLNSEDSIIYIEDLNFKRFNIDTEFVIVNRFDYSDYEILNIKGIDYELNQIWNIDNKRTWPKNSIIMPVVKVFLMENINKLMVTDNLSNFELSFTIFADNSNILTESEIIYPIYKELYVLNRQPDKSQDVTQIWQRQVMQYDLGYGKQDWLDKADKPFILYDYNFKFFTRKELSNFKTFANEVKGSLKDFWMPTFEKDIIANKDQNLINDNIIYIQNNNNENYNLKKNHIMIKLLNNEYLYLECEITNYNLENDMITLTENINLNTNDIEYICFLNKVRFSTDEFLFSYIDENYSQISKVVLTQ